MEIVCFSVSGRNNFSLLMYIITALNLMLLEVFLTGCYNITQCNVYLNLKGYY